MGLPTFQVLLDDDGTGTFPYDITSKCLLQSGASFTRGRDDWQGGVTAGSLSLTLNNSDGRFSPGSTVIASPSPIKVDQRIRLKETVNGVTFTRFTGYVKSWPVSWPATVATFSSVSLTATDAQARAERRVLRSIIEEEILPDAPAVYYMLSEPEGATSGADASGNQQPAVTMTGAGTAVTFGTDTGPGTDGLTAATFAGGQFLTTTLATSPTALVCYFSTTTTPAASTAMVLMAVANTAIGIDSTGKINSGSTFAGSPVVTDGATHCLVWEAGHAYLDGVDLGAPLTPSGTRLEVGGGTINDTVLGVPAVSFTGAMAHVAIFGSTTSAARALAYYQAGSTGFAGESGTARITRLAGYADVAVGTLDTSLTNVAFSDFSGSSAWQAIQDVADAELGVAYIAGDGTLVFHNRNEVVAKTSPDLTVMASVLSDDIQPVQDDQQILNYLEATAASTGVGQLANNAASEATHGRYSDSKTYLVQTDQEALDRANWIVANFAEPTTRFGTLTFNLYAMAPSVARTVLTAIEIDAWVRIQGVPSQMPGGTTVDVVVEGYTESSSGNGWTLTCNVVSQDLFSPVWVLGTSALDVDTRLYV